MIKSARSVFFIPNSIYLMLALFLKSAFSINSRSKLSRQPLSITTKQLTIITIVITVSCLSIPAAFAEHGHEHGHERGEEHGNWNGRGRGGNAYGYGNGYGYGYAQPVYAPPPVYMVPPQSPGINLILPLNFR
ncbi:hypothetical protein [Methylomonas sp. AM2-LC]|uniref:hypothetical protein n=1 Tax=Methylomonas sp. AM2-LC TaxID=3153301 RepID=UPI003266FB0C